MLWGKDRFDLFQSGFLIWGSTFTLKTAFTIFGIRIKCLLPELHAGALLLSFQLHAGAVLLSLLGARVLFSSVHTFRLICHWLCSSLMSPKLWSSLFSVPLLCNQYNLFWWCLTHLVLGKFPKGPKERTLHLEWMYQPQNYVRALSPRALGDKSKCWTSWEEENSFCSQMSSFICLQASWYLSPLKITLSIKKCICYVKWIGFEGCSMKITGHFFQYKQGNCRSP